MALVKALVGLTLPLVAHAASGCYNWDGSHSCECSGKFDATTCAAQNAGGTPPGTWSSACGCAAPAPAPAAAAPTAGCYNADGNHKCVCAGVTEATCAGTWTASCASHCPAAPTSSPSTPAPSQSAPSHCSAPTTPNPEGHGCYNRDKAHNCECAECSGGMSNYVWNASITQATCTAKACDTCNPAGSWTTACKCGVAPSPPAGITMPPPPAMQVASSKGSCYTSCTQAERDHPVLGAFCHKVTCDIDEQTCLGQTHMPTSHEGKEMPRVATPSWSPPGKVSDSGCCLCGAGCDHTQEFCATKKPGSQCAGYHDSPSPNGDRQTGCVAGATAYQVVVTPSSDAKRAPLFAALAGAILLGAAPPA